MKKIAITVKDPAGMHARPASILSKEAGKFASDITIEYGEKQSNMKSIMGILSMGIQADSDIVISIEGDDESDAHVALETVLKDTKIAG